MARIERVRPVLLSAPYASQDNLEVLTRLPTGWRTTGLVEIALDDGTTGLGEGYLAVFAPQVFVDIVEMLSPHLVGRDADVIASLYQELTRATGYWSRQGAARHVVAAIEIALVDAASKRQGVPAYAYLGGGRSTRLSLYASGGDSATPEAMAQEIEQVERLGLKTFKIRAGTDGADKAVWTLDRAAAAGISVAIDMTQNLAEPGHEPDDVYRFLAEVDRTIAFLEEPLSFSHLDDYPQLVVCLVNSLTVW